MSRRAVAVLLAAVVAGCGGEDRPSPAGSTSSPARAEPPPRLDLAGTDARRLGQGEAAVWVLRPADRPASGRTVLFLHGWTAVTPKSYAGWMEHLVARGHAVVYPVYQAPPFVSPQTALRNVVAGVRTALAADPALRRGPWLVTGHSAGGALAVDYAATAGAFDVPAPADVVSIYPGRKLRRLPPRLPEADARTIPARTRVTVFAGTRDEVVGTAPARRIARQTGGRLVVVRDPAIADHLGPQRDEPASRARFWRFVDGQLVP